ncbi:MAG: hypothetical protein H6621_00955 [Halobacteriovoraceae bacterium]|nr:hypothetical protein [Halobacteriovoraceae bacterium]MCB9093610.1 hypothetical protein [Halobacteriovoraceae bacterium]
MSSIVYPWVLDNLLAIFASVITLVLLYYYFIERGKGVKLSKKYRNSIFEVQSKIFLNATHYLISGDKDLAIKEFLNAVELNKETIDTYLTLGRLFRSNGEIEKAVSIHRSIIARDNISEATRLEALKELGKDFDKGGFLEKAIQTYRDVLQLNKEQVDVIKSLCRIYEDLEDWDEALKYRMMLSKLSSENQSETISHIYIEQAKNSFDKGEYAICWEKLEQAFRYAPSVSAKILQLKFYLVMGKMEDAKALMVEIINEHEMFVSFMFLSLQKFTGKDEDERLTYQERLNSLKDYFLKMESEDIEDKTAIFISKIQLLKDRDDKAEAYEYYKKWLTEHPGKNDVLKIEYIKLLISMGLKDEAIEETSHLLDKLQKASTRHYCVNCGYNSDDVFWRCPQCYEWETISFRLEV